MCLKLVSMSNLKVLVEALLQAMNNCGDLSSVLIHLQSHGKNGSKLPFPVCRSQFQEAFLLRFPFLPPTLLITRLKINYNVSQITDGQFTDVIWQIQYHSAPNVSFVHLHLALICVVPLSI